MQPRQRRDEQQPFRLPVLLQTAARAARGLPPLRIPSNKVHIVPQGKPGTNIIERYVMDDTLTLDDITYNDDGSVASLRVCKRDGSVITWQAS